MIRANCPTCGDLDLRPADVMIDAVGYRFECPSCTRVVSRTAARNVIELLALAGVRIDDDVPAEVFEVKVGPLFSHDDLVAFHELLDGDGWFDQLEALVDID